MLFLDPPTCHWDTEPLGHLQSALHDHILSTMAVPADLMREGSCNATSAIAREAQRRHALGVR